MTTFIPPELGTKLPDHTQLPDTDGSIVQNFQEHPQTILLTDSIRPVLEQLHPDKQFAIGQDSGVYWRIVDPPLDGCKAPDWFYVPNVPPIIIEGNIRRSYVLWQELIAPIIILELVSGDGSEERDNTPLKGKFWVYEQAIRTPYYGIFDSGVLEGARRPTTFEMYELVGGRYQKMSPNERGHYPIPPMGVEIGIWRGEYHNMNVPWMRWWDLEGNLIPTSEERIIEEQQRAEEAESRLDRERQRSERLEEQLRALGIEPEV